MSRLTVADVDLATAEVAALCDEGGSDESLVIEEHVPIPSGEHPTLSLRDSLPAMEVFDLRMSGMVPIDDRPSAPTPTPTGIAIPANDTPSRLPLAAITGGEAPAIGTAPTVPLEVVSRLPVPPVAGAAPVAIDDSATDATVKNRAAATSLGVAPLEPATKVRGPFVLDTPVQRQPQSHPITVPAVHSVGRHERTAMIALDPTSGRPRSGPWQALVSVAKSLAAVQWWVRRRKTSRVKPLER